MQKLLNQFSRNFVER